MALALVAENKVWQRVKAALANASPADQLVFRGLREYLATHKGMPDLQFIPFSEAQSIVNDGTDLVGEACTLYGVYAKAITAPTARTSTTSAFFSVHAAATSGATTTTLVTGRIKAAGQHFVFTAGDGLACETGLTVSAATAVGGQTESTTPDGADGFVIVGAA
jgi:hypothetical protein